MSSVPVGRGRADRPGQHALAPQERPAARGRGDPRRPAGRLGPALDPTMYGPSVPVHLTAFMDGRGRPAPSGPLDGDGRRSIYLAVRRNFLNPMFLAFDAPVPFSCMGRRNASNVPAQALILLNDPLVVQQAERVGRPHPRQAGRTDRERDRAARSSTAFGRPPVARTRHAACLDFLGALRLGRPLPCADQHERVHLHRLTRVPGSRSEGPTRCIAADSLIPG